MLKPFNFRALATLALVFAMVRTTGVAFGLAGAGGDVMVSVLGKSLSGGIPSATQVATQYKISQTLAEQVVAKVAILQPLALANGLAVNGINFEAVSSKATNLNLDVAAQRVQSYLNRASNGANNTEAFTAALNGSTFVQGAPTKRMVSTNANVSAADFACPAGASACNATLTKLNSDASLSASLRDQLKQGLASNISLAQKNAPKLCGADTACQTNLVNGIAQVYSAVPSVFPAVNNQFVSELATGTGQFTQFSKNYSVIAKGVSKIGTDAAAGVSPGEQLVGCFATGG